VTGTLTIKSNSSTNATVSVGLSGTGTSHQVSLTWSAPSSSSDPVAGYHIYRATGSSSSYTLLNSSVVTQTSYMDSTVVSGTSYAYYVKSVDASGVESAASNSISVTVPNP
jgi:fibronectin type 3 domain-containing protein